MADAAVEFLLSNLKQCVVDNVHSLGGIEDQVESLCNDLRILAAYIRNTVESRRGMPAVVEELIRQIRVQVYKAEDIIDKYVSVHKTRTRFDKLFHFKRRRTKEECRKGIEDIRLRVNNIRDNGILFGYEPMQRRIGRRPRVSFPPPFPEDDDGGVVGFDKESEEVVRWLKEGTKDLDVISVVGMGGLGKTTLVKKVYNDSSIRHEFLVRSWAYVSHVYRRREVFLQILRDVTRGNNNIDDDASQWSVEVLTENLRIMLQDVKYLIVLDDVWTKDAWDDLKPVFPVTKNGSRILLTSRNKDVAMHDSRNRNPYQLRFLTDVESWELLEKKVFPKGSHCPKDLEHLGKQIAQKCYGLPLALVVIARMLRMKGKTRSSWERVEEKVDTYVAMKPHECVDVLALSYDHLPYALKACFLYFSVFPENFEIPVRKLIHIWVAEGFNEQIRDAGGAEEMAAEKNLQDLVDRNLVLAEKRRANGGIKTCRIHHMLHSICIKRAEEEDFFKEIKGSGPSSYVKYLVFRRLVIHSKVSNHLSLKPGSTHVRSFLCYAHTKMVLAADLVPGSLQLLRVLDVQPISFSCFPSLRLVHLRYVAVSGTFKVLPAAISNLCNLQTLIVETTYPNIEVLVDLLKLSHLRHVYTSPASNLPTPSAKSEKRVKCPLVCGNLRTMSKVSPETCTHEIFTRTPNLQKLGVRGNLMSLMKVTKHSCKFDNIAKLTRLETLKLLNYTYANSPLDGKLRGLPEWDKFPPNLKKLTISGTMLNWEHMSTLGKLPSLEVLKLGDNAFVGVYWETPDRSFIRLRILEIRKTDLAIWKAVGDPFPQLRRLSLKHCEQLIAVPSGLGGIPTLEVVEFCLTSHSAIASARQLQRNFKVLVLPLEELN